METKQATSDKTSDKSKRLIDANALDFSFSLTDDMSGMLKQIGIEMVKARIMEFPTVDAAEVIRGQWIPVTERLPEHCVTVLSYDGRNYRTVKTDSYDHCFECWLSDMGDILDRNTVTHWMPLPEPPKEEPNG